MSSEEIQQTIEPIVEIDAVKSSFPETTYEEDLQKYTKIDNLDEDRGQEMYVLVSFASPENIMNCNVRALKIRIHNNTSVFNTYEHAKKAAEELNKVDKYFPIFVMPCGKWCAWDPSPDDKTKVAEQKWGDEKQQQLMDNLEVIEKRKLEKQLEKQKQNMTDMNALIGKTKAKIDTEKVDYKARKIDSINQGIKEKDTIKDTSRDTLQDELKLLQQSKSSHDGSKLKDKLRAKLEERRKVESATQDITSAQNISNTVDTLTEQVKTTAETSTKLEQNINKAKELLEKLKKSKSN
jgi:hypothetical protein